MISTQTEDREQRIWEIENQPENFMNDPFMEPHHVFNRLQDEYNKHKKLIIACDFDSTLFDYHKKGYKFPKLVALMKDCNALGFRIVIFSGSSKERHIAIHMECNKLGIVIDGINEDLIDWHPVKSHDWSRSKIYFNILLDDRAGLKCAYDALRNLVDELLKKRVDLS